MERLVRLLCLLAGVLPAMAAPYPDDAARTPQARQVAFPWPGCQTNLTCDYTTIQGAPFKERQLYLIYMERYEMTYLNVSDQFAALEGVHQFLVDQGLAETDTWISYVEAGTLEAVQRAVAILRGYTRSDVTGGNPGTAQWVAFISQINSGGYASRQAQDKAWSLAEQASSAYGVQQAANAGKAAPYHVQRWGGFFKLYRQLMQDQTLIKNTWGIASLGNGYLPRNYNVADFDAWFFNVSNPNPLYCYSTAVWEATKTWLVNATPLAILNDAAFLLAIQPPFNTCYKSAAPKAAAPPSLT